MRRQFFLSVLFFFLARGLVMQAQDIHFSQFLASPSWLNPALTGSFHEDFRVISVRRSQWNSFTNGFQTLAFSCETNLLHKNFPGVPLSMGLLFRSDRAGDGQFGITELALPLAYHFRLTERDEWLTFSMMPAIVQNGLNLNALTFGSQFNGDAFDPSAPTYENQVDEGFSYFDLSTGMSAGIFIGPDIRSRFGVSLFHFLRPGLSFKGDREVRLFPKINVHASATIRQGRQLSWEPGFMISRQAKQHEVVFGTMLRYQTGSDEIQALTGGLFSRWGDALIACWGLEYRNIRGVLSYDLNLSGLRKASQYKGGPELSLVYVFDLNQKLPTVPVKDCPPF